MEIVTSLRRPIIGHKSASVCFHISGYMHCFVASSLICVAILLMPNSMIELSLVSHIISALCHLLIVHTFGIPSPGCPKGRLVVSSANVRCNGSGRRAVKERHQLDQTVLVGTD